MLAVAYSRAQVGISATLVTVETHLSMGLPGFAIVGLPETAVKESKDRVRSAIINSQLEFPIFRIIVNLAPADLPKEGGRFDLPIAVGVLAASGQIPTSVLDEYEFAGELALSGELRPIQGGLPSALGARKDKRKLIISAANAHEASLAGDLSVYPAQNLLEVCNHLKGTELIKPFSKLAILPHHKAYSVDMADVKGQYQARRALEVAAAGGHSLLMIGPPGTGKTMLASRLPTILPPLSDEEALEVAALASLSRNGINLMEWKKRPFRTPHHTASGVALVGGGSSPRPGEISLAHYGVLFLDELPEFDRRVLEVLREPLESRRITISRAARQAEFPADFQLIAAMNPCPCGHLGDVRVNCRCSKEQVYRYHAKISGPLLDRIDMHIEVGALPLSVLSQSEQPIMEDSTTIRSRVCKAREIQHQRSKMANYLLQGEGLEKVCNLGKEQQLFIDHAIRELNLSARSYHRILRVARTLADLAEQEVIEASHLAEAMSYRCLDKFNGISV